MIVCHWCQQSVTWEHIQAHLYEWTHHRLPLFTPKHWWPLLDQVSASLPDELGFLILAYVGVTHAAQCDHCQQTFLTTLRPSLFTFDARETIPDKVTHWEQEHADLITELCLHYSHPRCYYVLDVSDPHDAAIVRWLDVSQKALPVTPEYPERPPRLTSYNLVPS